MKRAQALIDDASLPLGTTESYPLPGVTAFLRLEPHVWSRNEKGELIQGCFRSVGIYLPDDAPEGAGVYTPEKDKWERAATILTVASLVVGIGAVFWGRS
jgi:hypothetical protein